jgi:hypothetical protein
MIMVRLNLLLFFKPADQTVPQPEFCTRENGVTKGERTEQKRGTRKYERSCSLCADDAALFFNSIARLKRGASCL